MSLKQILQKRFKRAFENFIFRNLFALQSENYTN